MDDFSFSDLDASGRDWRVTMLLADDAFIKQDRLYIWGAGWNMCMPGLHTSCIVLMIDVPWHRMEEEHTILLELVDEDGQPILVEQEGGPTKAEIEAHFTATPHPDVPVGSTYTLQETLPIGPIHLPAGCKFQWRMTLNSNERSPSWYLNFETWSEEEEEMDEQ